MRFKKIQMKNCSKNVWILKFKILAVEFQNLSKWNFLKLLENSKILMLWTQLALDLEWILASETFWQWVVKSKFNLRSTKGQNSSLILSFKWKTIITTQKKIKNLSHPLIKPYLWYSKIFRHQISNGLSKSKNKLKKLHIWPQTKTR